MKPVLATSCEVSGLACWEGVGSADTHQSCRLHPRSEPRGFRRQLQINGVLKRTAGVYNMRMRSAYAILGLLFLLIIIGAAYAFNKTKDVSGGSDIIPAT